MLVFPDLPNEEFALSHTGGNDGTKRIVYFFQNQKED